MNNLSRVKSLYVKVKPLKYLYRFLWSHKRPKLILSYSLSTEWPKQEELSWDTYAVFARYAHATDIKPSRTIIANNLQTLGLIPTRKLSLLDFGCAGGDYYLYLRDNPHTANWSYTGADISERLISICKKKYPYSRFVVVNRQGKLPFSTAEFDVVLASGSLQYVKEYKVLLEELCRISKNYILVSRLPTVKNSSTGICIQSVQHKYGQETHPFHYIKQEDFVALENTLGLTQIYHKDGGEAIHIPNMDEPIISSTYLLQLKSPVVGQAFEKIN